MQVTDLKAILDYEHNEQWLAALNCYKGIWDHNPTDDVAIRYCFFCWYLIWQWEQIDFPGEDISFEAKITVDNRMGISKAELEHMVALSSVCFAEEFDFSNLKKSVDSNSWSYIGSATKDSATENGELKITKMYDADGNETSLYSQVYAKATSSGTSTLVTSGSDKVK